MLKLVIVDDEPIILTGLVKTFPWEKWGYEVVGSAGSGTTALELIERLHPDLVLTDIRMNNMTGLELMKQSLLSHPEVLFIVMSAYRDFDYAKEACRLGAYTYLLKPLKEDALQETMLTAKDFYIRQQEYSSFANHYQAFLEKHADGYVSALFRSYIQEQLTDDRFTDALSFIEKDWDSMDYFCVCATVDSNANIYPTTAELYMLLHYLRENLNRYFDGWTFEGNDGNLLLFLTLPAGTMMKRHCLNDMFQAFQTSYHMGAIYSVSSVYPNILDIKQAAKEASDLFAMADNVGLDRLYPDSYIAQDHLPELTFQYPRGHTAVLLKAIQLTDFTAAKQALENFIMDLAPITDTDFQKLCIQRLTLEIFSSFIGPEFPQPLRKEFEDFNKNFGKIPLLKTIPILNGHITKLIQHLEKRSNLDTSSTTLSYVEKAKLYAHTHISDEQLNVTVIADILHFKCCLLWPYLQKRNGNGV